MDMTETMEFPFEEIIKEADKAYCIKFNSEEIHWLPKSQVRVIGNIVHIPEWLAKKTELI